MIATETVRFYTEVMRDQAAKALPEMMKAVEERDELIATLRADNIKLAEQCNALREGRPFADGASKNP